MYLVGQISIFLFLWQLLLIFSLPLYQVLSTPWIVMFYALSCLSSHYLFLHLACSLFRSLHGWLLPKLPWPPIHTIHSGVSLWQVESQSPVRRPLYPKWVTLTAWSGVTGGSGNGKKWLDSGCILKVESREWMVYKAEIASALQRSEWQ